MGEEASWLLTPSTVLHGAARSSLSANKASIAAVRFLGRQAAVTRAAGLRELRSFDKLSAYRNMLESGVATVTARATKDGVETYKLRAVVPGIGGSDLSADWFKPETSGKVRDDGTQTGLVEI